MNTIGIIAEYNPFHNGHLYQIQQIKKQTGAQNIVVAMSGDYVQRGTPAWTDKYLRAQMALSCGASLVFELPVAFSTASAEAFAFAGVSLLTSLGFVDGICFGCECSNLPLLQKIADFLSSPPACYEETIARLVAKGLSYPTAREKALSDFFEDECKANPALLSSPNNILALEYLKAISLLHSPLTPFAIQRNDKGYHHDTMTGVFSSASAIRKESLQHPSSFLSAVATAIPEKVCQFLSQEPKRYPVTENHFSDLLYYRLNQLTEQDKNILDMTNEIFHRIQNQLASYTNYSEFITQIKTKQYTYSRISRVLLHCLLSIYAQPASDFSTCPNPFNGTLPFVPYARLLGFSKKKSSLLRTESKLPIITKPADGISKIKAFYSCLCNQTNTSLLSSDNHTQLTPSSAYFENVSPNKPYATADCALKMYQQDIKASNLYRQVQSTALGCIRPDEYRCQPIIWEK